MTHPTARLFLGHLLSALLAVLLLARPASADECTARQEVAEAAGATADPVPVWSHRPAGWADDGRVVVVLHGLNRAAAQYCQQWRSLAEAHQFLLLVPEFTKAKFPGLRWYNYGNVIDDEGRPTPPANWTFHALDRVVLAAMRSEGARRTGFAVYGHSAGAQFLHRYLLLTGAPHAETVVIANSGSYTLPRGDRAFPEGLGNIAAVPGLRRAVLGRAVVLLLGELDTDPMHHQLPKQPWAVAQGSHRFARGWFFFDTMRLAASAQGMAFSWRVVTAPGVGHSNGGMARFAAQHLFALPP